MTLLYCTWSQKLHRRQKVFKNIIGDTSNIQPFYQLQEHSTSLEETDPYAVEIAE